jgi:two-component system nitrate/nitrite response regulator NarL
MKILIADDNMVVRTAISSMLEDIILSVEVSHAQNGEIALEKVTHEDFDLILMDISMPVMDGIQATTAIHEMKPHQKIVAVSMHADNEDLAKMRQAGARGYILKHEVAEKIHPMLDAVMSGGAFFPECF